VAAHNAQRHGVAGKIEFLQGDLLSTLPQQQRFDFVVSNPPYVSSDEMTALARDVRQFEPREALEAGPRGSEVIERLIPQAAQQLVRGGWLLLEISPQLDSVVRQLVENDSRLELFPTVKDLAGLARVVQARKK
jgi:release factor glutamine methyltransferase